MIVNKRIGVKTISKSHAKTPAAILTANQVKQGFVEYTNGQDYNLDYDKWSYAHQWNYETGRMCAAYNVYNRLGVKWPDNIQYPNRIKDIKALIRADKEYVVNRNNVNVSNEIVVDTYQALLYNSHIETREQRT